MKHSSSRRDALKSRLLLTGSSIGNKASCPYTKKKGVKPVDHLYMISDMPIEHHQGTYPMFLFYLLQVSEAF